VFFANVDDDQYSNERSGTSVKTARENGVKRYGRARLARFTREDRNYARRVPKRPKTTVLQSTLSAVFVSLERC